MRVTSKQKRVKSRGSIKHLDFTSSTHTHDRQAADRLRTSVQVELPSWPRREIEFADRLAILGVCKDGDWKKATSSHFEDHCQAVRSSRSWYRDKNGKKRQSKGAVLDTYISLPPWWTKSICDAVRAGTITVEQARKAMVFVGLAALKTLADRSGYEPVHLSIHPESEANCHVHMGFATVTANNKLCGRSANGEVGRKGLRNAGDSNLAVHRFSPYVSNDTPTKWREVIGMCSRKAEEKDFDDVAAGRAIEANLQKIFPSLKAQADANAVQHVRDWVAKQELTEKSSPERVEALAAENQQLKSETIPSLQKSNQALEKRLDSLIINNKRLTDENESLKFENSSLKVSTQEIEAWEAESSTESVKPDNVPSALRKQIKDFCNTPAKLAALNRVLDNENEHER